MKLTEERINELTALGFNRWTKGNMDRLYINASQLGLKCTYYKTGNISYAEFNGEKISNSRASRMKASKTYIDIMTGKLYSDSEELKVAVKKLFDIHDTLKEGGQ